MPMPSGESVVARVPCRTSRNHRVAPNVHEIVIHPDWSVSTPHDLAAERIAVAFGGHLSCIGLVQDVVPALQHWIQLMLRLGDPPYVGRSGRWTVADSASCCRDREFDGAASAASHARGLQHVANRFGAELDLLTSLAAVIAPAQAPSFELEPRGDLAWRASAACAGGFADVEYLFQCGIVPERIVEFQSMAATERPLRRAFYVAAAIGQIDPSEPGVAGPYLSAAGGTAGPLADYARYRARITGGTHDGT